MSTPSTTMTLAAGQRSRKVDRWFYIGVALLMILFNAVAFTPAMIDQSRRNVPLPLSPLVALHASVSALWLLLFFAQAAIATTRRIDVHRRVGVLGAVLTLVFVVLGYFTVIEEARRGFDLSGDLSRFTPPGASVTAEETLAGTIAVLFNFFMFAVLVGVALLYRDRPAVHKRLMLLAVLGVLTGTPVTHVLGYWLAPQPWLPVMIPVSAVFFLSLSAVHDRMTNGRVHPVSLWVPLAIFASFFLFNFVVVPSRAWRQFAAWLIQ